MPKVSIIAPVYGVEACLDKCVESVLNQTYSDWELLLVDDGSPDKSGDICDAWSRKDNRIRVFHKENGGVSSARNLGLEKMNGEYVTFLDSDDWLDVNCLQTCLDVLTENDLDVLQFAWIKVLQNGSTVVHKRVNTPVCVPKEFAKQGVLSVSVWGAIYNSKIISDNKIRFDESMAYAEDQLFVFMCLNCSRRIKAIDMPLYYYFDNQSSVMHNLNADKLVKSCSSFARNKDKVGCYESYIDVHNMYMIIELVSHLRTPKSAVKNLYYSLNIQLENIDNKKHRCFVRLAAVSFDIAYLILYFYRKYICIIKKG